MTARKNTDKDVTPDTSTIIRMIRSSNNRDLLRVRKVFDGKIVHICEQAAKEARKHGAGRKAIRSMFEALNATVVFDGASTRGLRDEAKAMEGRNKGLHSGDSEIAASAKSIDSVLCTRDKPQGKAAVAEGMPVVNPDGLLGSDGWFRGRYGRGHFGPSPPRHAPSSTPVPRRRHKHRRRACPRVSDPRYRPAPGCAVRTARRAQPRPSSRLRRLLARAWAWLARTHQSRSR